MPNKPRLFWDSSALLDAIFALNDTPYADLLDLGEVDEVDMRVSPDVLRECEAILRQINPARLPIFLALLREAGFATTPLPNEEMVDYCEQLTGYRPDARVLAAAEECLADLLVTHDKQHFIGNPLISPPDTHCRVRTAQEALDWSCNSSRPMQRRFEVMSGLSSVDRPFCFVRKGNAGTPRFVSSLSVRINLRQGE